MTKQGKNLDIYIYIYIFFFWGSGGKQIWRPKAIYLNEIFLSSLIIIFFITKPILFILYYAFFVFLKNVKTITNFIKKNLLMM